jgi:hypothetical protein
MKREIYIAEFLQRLENCTEKHEGYAVAFNKTAARAALDHLFADLRDFCGEITVQGTPGGVIDPYSHVSKGTVLREIAKANGGFKAVEIKTKRKR